MRLIDSDVITIPKGFFETVDNVPKFYGWLNEQPTVDAVSVVRCKNCINKPKEHQYCVLLEMYVVDEFFCAEGERRKEC